MKTKPLVPASVTIIQNDGWINAITNLGKQNVDKTTGNQVAPYTLLDDAQLASIWMGDGIGRKVVAAPVDDGVRPWFEVEADTEGKLVKELDRLKARQALREAGYWARLYGGSIILMGFADGLDLAVPRTASDKEMTFLKAYPRTRTWFTQEDLGKEGSAYYDQAEWFMITKLDGTQVRVHRSRCLCMFGAPAPGDKFTSQTLELRFWGTSVLQAGFDRLAALGTSFQAIDNLLQEFAVGKFKITGLAEILSSNNTKPLYDRMEIIKASMGVINAVLMDADANEDYTREIVPLSGVTDYLDRVMMMVSGVWGIPMTRLFGRSPAGLSATGESDLKTYYDEVQNWQTTEAGSIMTDLVRILNVRIKAVAEDDIKLVWGNPNSPTPVESLTMKKTQADTMVAYINAGVLTPQEVRENVFAGGHSFEISVDPEEELPEPPAKANEKGSKGAQPLVPPKEMGMAGKMSGRNPGVGANSAAGK